MVNKKRRKDKQWLTKNYTEKDGKTNNGYKKKTTQKNPDRSTRPEYGINS
jgi:hypothetical protein